jgi:Amt family ammonium transporter
MPTTSTRSTSQHRQSWFYVVLLWLLCCQCTAYAEEKTATPPSVPAVEQKATPVATDKTKPATETADAESEPKTEAQAQLENSMDNVKVIEKTLAALRKEIDSSKKGAVLNRTSIKDALDLINSQLKGAYTGLDGIRSNIATNAMGLEKLKADLSAIDTRLKNNASELEGKINTNAADISSQKFLVENYAAGGYEILLKMADISTKLENLSQGQTVQNDQKQDERISMIKDLNRLWILLAVVLVSVTPLAFVLSCNREHYKPLQDGTPQHKAVLLVCLSVFMGYFMVGFGLMFGKSAGGWLGISSYVLGNKTIDPTMTPLFDFAEFALYQANFTLFAALIVYVAVGRQLSSAAHLLLALFVAIVLVPVFGHWAWAGHYITGNKGWLESAGFIDAGGSTTIHSVSAWFALALAWKLGSQKPPSHDPDQTENDPVYSSAAVLILWLSSLGFTTGSLSISNIQIAATMLNVGLAASAGGITAFLHYRYSRIDKGQMTRALGGCVTGLVAVAASAPTLSLLEAVLVGASAGIIHNIGFSLLRKYVLHQAWQVRTAYMVAIHGLGGVWGTLCVVMFGSEGPSISLLAAQLEGIAIALVYSVGLANVVFLLFSVYKRRGAVTH